MYAPKKKGIHTKIGKIYFYAMALVCLSAVPLSILHWQTSWWFLLVSAFSFSFAWRGYEAVKNRHEGWVRHHISGMLGSYIAMSTALLVVNSSISLTLQIYQIIFIGYCQPLLAHHL